MGDYNKMKTELLINFYADEICWFLDVSKKDVFSKRKLRDLADIRAMICYLVKKQHPKAVLQHIGEYFDQTHATVVHSIKKIEDLKNLDMKIKRTIEHCENVSFRESIFLKNLVVKSAVMLDVDMFSGGGGIDAFFTKILNYYEDYYEKK
jgi:hypothetical protein